MAAEPTHQDVVEVPVTADPHLLAQFLDPGFPGQRVWMPSELGAILHHLMAVPMPFDLSALPPGTRSRLQTLGAANGLLLNSLAALLHHPHPPVELLLLLKRYAKSNHEHPDSALPAEISTVLYILSIVVARQRCQRRITALNDDAVLSSIDWVLALPWLDDKARCLLRQGREAFAPSRGVAHGSAPGSAEPA